MKIVPGSFQSDLLQRELPYRVILPEKYEHSLKNYPVIYLLHGLFGSCDNWLELTCLTEYALEKELIIVLVEGENSWYCDSETVKENKFESSFISELMPEIEKLFRVIGQQRKRAIAGLSMGGYGALKFALKRPDLFIFAASMSGAFEAPNQNEKNQGSGWEELGPSILEVFGAEKSQTRTENDLFRIVEKLPEEKIDNLPSLYIDCGVEDGFLEINRKFAGLLKDKKIEVEYKEISGSHDWEYWNKQIKYILRIADQRLNLVGD